MSKNITLRLDDSILRLAKKLAFDQDVSLSQWVSGLITTTVNQNKNYKKAKKRAIKNLKEGFDLQGAPLSRDDIYER